MSLFSFFKKKPTTERETLFEDVKSLEDFYSVLDTLDSYEKLEIPVRCLNFVLNKDYKQKNLTSTLFTPTGPFMSGLVLEAAKVIINKSETKDRYNFSIKFSDVTHNTDINVTISLRDINGFLRAFKPVDYSIKEGKKS